MNSSTNCKEQIGPHPQRRLHKITISAFHMCMLFLIELVPIGTFNVANPQCYTYIYIWGPTYTHRGIREKIRGVPRLEANMRRLGGLTAV